LTQARDRIPDFAFDAAAPAGGHVVVQYLTAQWLTSICRAPTGDYWYFNRSRDPAKPWEGVLSRAEVSGSAFVANYPGGQTQYVAERQGTAVVGVGVDPLESFVCAVLEELPANFLDPAAAAPPPCSQATATTWALP
jgi:hypothetical protein